MPRTEMGVRPPETLDPKDLQKLETVLTAGLCVSEAEEVRECFTYVRGLFGDKKRQDDVTPSWFHSYMVAFIIKDEFGINRRDNLLGGLLHDVVEDCGVSVQELEGKYGWKVASLVDGVTKLKKQNGEDDDPGTRVKVVSWSYVQPEVGIIKLADRLHNMRTLEHVPRAKQLEKATETRDVYIPLAEAWGLWQVKQELEDGTFRYLNPDKYREMVGKMEADPRLNPDFRRYVESVVYAVVGVEFETEVETRIKGVWRTEAKSALKGLPLVNDLLKVRVIVGDDKRKGLSASQTRALVVDRLLAEFGDQVHFDERDTYIYAHKRPNGYSAEQLTIEFKDRLVEVAVVTEEEENFNNWGVVTLIRQGEVETVKSLKPVMVQRGEKQEDARAEFLPVMATVLDVAFGANPQMAKHLVSAWVGKEQCGLTEVVKSGSVVRLIYDECLLTIKPEWQEYCLPETARLIEKQLHEVENEKVMEGGRQQIESVLRHRGLMSIEDIEPGKVKRVWDALGDSKDMLNADLKLYGWEYVCWAVGAGLIEQERIERALDEAGVTLEQMDVTTVLMKGEMDQPGILYRLVTWLNTANDGRVNVESTETKSDGRGGYVVKMVLKGLSADKEECLRQFLAGHVEGGFSPGFFSEWTVVGRRDGGAELVDSTFYVG